jgi:hypothetical protein
VNPLVDIIIPPHHLGAVVPDPCASISVSMALTIDGGVVKAEMVRIPPDTVNGV